MGGSSVPSGPNPAFWTPPKDLDSTDVELLAMAWALLAALAQEAPAPVTIWSDSLNAVEFPNGRSNSKANRDIARPTYALLARSRHRCEIQICHVKGHVEYPWDTIVDNIARATMK
eukprot:3413391-Pyramimonas_sp.AAC.1